MQKSLALCTFVDCSSGRAHMNPPLHACRLSGTIELKLWWFKRGNKSKDARDGPSSWNEGVLLAVGMIIYPTVI